MLRIYMALSAILFFSAVFAGASGEKHPKTHDHHHEMGHHHSHHIGLFSGFTNDLEKHNEFTLGLDYSYSLPVWEQRLGIGAFGEVVFAEHIEYLLGVPLLLKPASSLFLQIAPGIVIVDTGSAEEEHHSESQLAKVSASEEDGHESSSNNHFLFRLGAGYGIDLGNPILTPTVNLDLVDGTEFLVFGISLGKGF